MRVNVDFSKAIIANLPCLIKSKTSSDGKRLLEVQASSEAVDDEGDQILQKALLDSSESFLKHGHCDLDHIGEIGPRLGIDDYLSYIIGRPVEVKDMGKGNTNVVCEIMKSSDGTIDIKKNRYDSFWESLQSDPPVQWRASIYGFPVEDGTTDCREQTCKSGATRFVVSKMDWKSLALTRNPVNTSLTGHAKIVTAKAQIELMKGQMAKGPLRDSMNSTMESIFQYVPCPYDMNSLIGYYERHIKPNLDEIGGKDSMVGFKEFFEVKSGANCDQAEMLASALMYWVISSKTKSKK